MKKNKVLYRCYVGSYFLWLFGALLAPLLFIRFSPAFAITMAILAALALAGMIVSHVFYNRKREWYFYPSYISHGVNAALIAAAFLTEMIYCGQGKNATYAIVISSICLVFEALVVYYLIRTNMALAKTMAKEQAALEAERIRLENLEKEKEAE